EVLVFDGDGGVAQRLRDLGQRNLGPATGQWVHELIQLLAIPIGDRAGLKRGLVAGEIQLAQRIGRVDVGRKGYDEGRHEGDDADDREHQQDAYGNGGSAACAAASAAFAAILQGAARSRCQVSLNRNRLLPAKNYGSL